MITESSVFPLISCFYSIVYQIFLFVPVLVVVVVFNANRLTESWQISGLSKDRVEFGFIVTYAVFVTYFSLTNLPVKKRFSYICIHVHGYFILVFFQFIKIQYLIITYKWKPSIRGAQSHNIALTQ